MVAPISNLHQKGILKIIFTRFKSVITSPNKENKSRKTITAPDLNGSAKNKIPANADKKITAPIIFNLLKNSGFISSLPYKYLI